MRLVGLLTQAQLSEQEVLFRELRESTGATHGCLSCSHVWAEVSEGRQLPLAMDMPQ